MVLRQVLTDILSDAFEKCGYERGFGSVSVSGRPDLCQFQCNGALTAAKQYTKAPMLIAKEVVGELASNTTFSSAEAVAPGFINLSIADGMLSEIMNDMYHDSRLLLPTMESLTIIIDFGGPNIAKPLHIGHLRSAIIGDCLCRLARLLGHTVIGDIHLGDWGLQMGLVTAEIKRAQPELVYFDPDYSGEYPKTSPVTVDELNDLYPAASVRAKTDEVFSAEAAIATVELQNLRKGYYELWKCVRDVSVADLRKNYALLGVHFDQWLGESDADEHIPRVVNLLTERGLLQESAGAMVVEVALPDDNEPIPPMLVEKSNGGDVYGTTDLGTLYQRMRDWQPDEIWYVVDNRQALHFKQVFRCANLAGITGDAKCLHIGFGTMNGDDGKPYKTRDGGVMRLSDMIETVTSSAYERANKSAVINNDDERTSTAKTVGIAALKIGDLVNHRTKDYVFDIDRFLASEGKTGPYLQYSAVRIKSVLQKASSAEMEFGQILPPSTEIERELMLSLTTVSDSVLRAYEGKAPNVICEALFDIAGVFNRFYVENKILVCPDIERRTSWLSLLELTYRMLTQLLELLGIDIPEVM